MRESKQVSVRNRVRLLILEIVMILVAAVFLTPIYYMLVTTVKTPAEAMMNPLGLPQKPTIATYVRAWQYMNYPHVLMNNLIITTSAILAILLFSTMASYAIVRNRSRTNRALYVLFISGIMIPLQMLIIPLYQLILKIHLMDSLVGVILIFSGIYLPFAILLISAFIRTIPADIEEAARIDGCSVIKTLALITFPLLKPVIATVAILDALAIWNDFMIPLLFLQTRRNSVILLEVFRNVGQFFTEWTKIFPMLTLGVAPLLLFYLLMQRFIIKGVVSGSLKQ